jgi:DNA (cytosine-5)-methyltransferase 1
LSGGRSNDMGSETINSPSSDDCHHSIVPYISLCSGYEGIGLGLGRCINGLRAIAYCEREAFAITNLVAKMENGLLDAAPVFTDVSTFPWQQFAPFMAGGILSFGWPCQPVSTAGKRKATEDERWLFDIIADGIAILQPGLLFAENVEGLLSAKMPDGSSVFGYCIERLERLHYRVAAGIFSASEVGAPHQRKRVFILAHLVGSGLERLLHQPCQEGWKDARRPVARCRQHRGDVWPSRPGEQQHGWEPPRVVAGRTAMDDSKERNLRSDSQDQRETDGESHTSNESSDGGRKGELADSHRLDRSAQAEGREHDRQAGPAGEELGDSQSGNGEGQQVHLRQGKGEHRGASGSECEGRRQTQPSLGGDADGPARGLDHAELCVSCDNRTDELRLLGNGVVPATAERAFRVLIQELL